MSEETTAVDVVNAADERAMRRAKRAQLIENGIDPYPSKSTVTHHVEQVRANWEQLEAGQDTEDVVSVAGRIRAIRN